MSEKLTQAERLDYFRYAERPIFVVQYLLVQLFIVIAVCALIFWIIGFSSILFTIVVIWFATRLIIKYIKYTAELSTYNKKHQSIDASMQALVCERLSGAPDAVMKHYKIDEDDLKGKAFLYAHYSPAQAGIRAKSCTNRWMIIGLTTL